MYNSLAKSGIDNDSLVNSVKSSDAYIKLVENGVFDNEFDENISNINDLLKKNEEDYNDAFEDYQTDLADIERHKKDHTVSAYYTRQANKPNQDNWFYSQPTTAGLSASSWMEQAASFAAGITTSVALNAAAGAAAGSVVPGAGTIAGGVAGGLRGLAVGIGKFLLTQGVIGATSATVAQVAGGMQARESESHIEAFDAYSKGLSDNLAERGIDSHKVAENLRKQAEELGYSNINDFADNDIIAMAAADNRFKFDFDGGKQVV